MNFADQIRYHVLVQSKRAGVGHIGSALSVADLIGVLYESILYLPSPRHPERDLFILSKGHAALAQYAALFLKGIISAEDLNTYAADHSKLSVHPEFHLQGIDFSTGSLGHGPAVAVGAALAAKMQNKTRRIFCLLSDAELNEGSVWEAMQFAAHHQLNNLIFILDYNKQQALGFTAEVIDLSPIDDKLRAFGWESTSINGHNRDEILQVLNTKTLSHKPRFIIAHTILGKGVSFMEKTILWHYKSMSDEEYHHALEEIKNAQ